ncbi:hypothetical protein Sjap_018098 [Stephania japonica]|uniref:Uncharacterized protein n=1 Tax=Stephania japonica TaxID=461633 RepID=A0AAP0I7C9_9MAGN
MNYGSVGVDVEDDDKVGSEACVDTEYMASQSDVSVHYMENAGGQMEICMDEVLDERVVDSLALQPPQPKAAINEITEYLASWWEWGDGRGSPGFALMRSYEKPGVSYAIGTKMFLAGLMPKWSLSTPLSFNWMSVKAQFSGCEND